MVQCEQQLLERSAPPGRDAERAARETLKSQIARLERELSAIVANRFPFIAAPSQQARAAATGLGPRLPDLGEPRAVAGQHRIGGVKRIDHASGQSACGA